MINKHFFKTVILFTAMIILGLLGVFLVSYFDQRGSDVPTKVESKTQVAK